MDEADVECVMRHPLPTFETDRGGSTTMAWRNPATGAAELLNTPSDEPGPLTTFTVARTLRRTIHER
jgi:hypothetical protein